MTSIVQGFIGLILLGAAIATPFMYVGAKLAMIEKATYKRTLLAAMASSIACWALTAALYPVPLLGSCSGFVLGLAASMGVIRLVFNASTSQAFTVWILHLFAEVVALFLALITFGSALHFYMTLPLPPR